MKVLLMLAALGAAYGQRPSFEVASVKPSPPPEGAEVARIRAMEQMQSMTPPGFLPLKDRALLSLRQYSLLQLVAAAYRVKPGDVTGPGWISDARFDIEAKLPEGASTKDANEMLQVLLEERFALRTHRETRGAGGFVLTVAKGGPRLAPPAEASAPPDPEEMKRRLQKRMEEAKQGRGRMVTSWGSSRATMAQIADAVSRLVKAPVADETGLDGRYSVELEIPPPESDDDSIEHRVAQAVAKLGLKLEPRKASVTVLVIDSAARTPAPN